MGRVLPYNELGLINLQKLPIKRSLPTSSPIQVNDEATGYSIQFDPKTSNLDIQFTDNQTPYTLQLYNSSGLFIRETKSKGAISWNLSDLEKNIYFIRVYNQNTGKAYTEKILKNN
jgi:hypothetical protein